MRGIKFRAWDKRTTEIIEWEYIKLNSEPFCWDDEDYTLMQYTGAEDKNSVEIYEDDLVENENGVIGKVIFYNFGYCLDYGLFKVSISRLKSNELKIAGNIYENKELI